MRASFTNRALGVGGDANTTSVTVRLPDPVVEFMDSHFDGRIKNRSEFLQHWAQVGVRVSLSPELTEALDWALQESEKPEPEPTILDVRMESEPIRATMTMTPSPNGDELADIREAQLEALRSRVR